MSSFLEIFFTVFIKRSNPNKYIKIAKVEVWRAQGISKWKTQIAFKKSIRIEKIIDRQGRKKNQSYKKSYKIGNHHL